MKEIRILFTGVGRRIELIQAFRDAALNLNVDLKIYGADMSNLAPALVYCDYERKVCSMKDSNYVSELVEICKQDKIDLLIPTIDTDLLLLSQNVPLFNKTKVLISKTEKIAICRDKSKTASFFESCNCKTPKTVDNWEKYSGTYPCFIKPKDGSASIDANKVKTAEELEMYAKNMNGYIVQPFIDGTEYTVDVFCDFDGNPIYITPRTRLQIRAGEVLRTQISMDKQIIGECKRIINRFKPVGPITIQLIRDKITGEDYFTEINPRYGGGAPLSMKAGARSAEVLLKLLLNQDIQQSAIVSDEAIYNRFDQSVCVRKGTVTQLVKGVIFDLDDTLYNEKEYVKSGYKAIAEYLDRDDAYINLWSYFELGKPAIDMYLDEIGHKEEKVNCLKIYREHIPILAFNNGVLEIIKELKSKNIKVGIITDGRPIGQRNKIAALGLEEMMDDIVVTDELGGKQFRKPCDIAFRIIQRRWKIPFEQMLYVGDNINKDFQAPKQLGMQWLWFKNSEGMYVQKSSDETIKNNKITCLYELMNSVLL